MNFTVFYGLVKNAVLWIWIRMDPYSFDLLDPDPDAVKATKKCRKDPGVLIL